MRQKRPSLMPDPIAASMKVTSLLASFEDEAVAYQALKAGLISVEDEDGNTLTLTITGTKVWGDRASGWVSPSEKAKL